ncbi:MAG: hypothetical protein IKJ06_01480, partial [Clostridia bacterium]|nr:hypothetical protein [Clostridia bacterium]
DYTGEAYVKISLVANSDVTVTITASDGKYDGSGSVKASYTKALSVSTADSYYFGSYTFKPGDTVVVSNPAAIASQGMELVPTEAVYLDTTMIDTTGWAGSGLYNFNGTKTYYTSGADVTATWDIPDTISAVSDIYYFFPENGGKSDSSLTFELKDVQGNITTWSYGGDNMAPGWHKVTYADFSETKYETISVKKGSGTYARLTGFKFVEKKDPYQSFLVTSDNLLSVGAWERVYEGGSIHLRYKDYLLKSSAKSTNPALGSYNLPNGTYNLYVHSADFSSNQGTRTFHFKANNSNIYKKYKAGWLGSLGQEITYFGTHGEITDSSGEGWKWEKSETPITITNGHLELKAYTDAANARFDAVLISNDPFISLNQDTQGYDDSSVTSAADTACYLKKVSVYENDIAYPAEYQEAHTSISSTATLSNSNTAVTFNLGTSADGTQSVQRKTEVGGVETVGYDDGLGFLVIYANSATKLLEDYYPRFNTSYTYSDDEGSMTIKGNTGNVFEAGQPEWLIPTTLTQVDANTVTMTASGTLADITATWTLEAGDKEPKVSVQATTKKAGEYSFGFFNNVNEISRAEVGYVLNPYRWQESRYPDRGTLVPEAFSTTNHTQMTYKPNSSGQEITLGVAVDESSVTKGHWTHMQATQTKKDFKEQDMTLDYTLGQSKFGMNTTGNQGGALPAVFAPLIGSETSTFTSGQTFEFAYRPLSTVSTSRENTGWYDCYSHVVKDLRGVYDYRDNYFASMTDTVFNILDLMKDDSLSGWSNDMLAHYYTEDTNNVEVSDALVYLQNYLLTDDKDLLMRRTLPSMAYMLTRNKSGFTDEYSYGGATEGPINKELAYSDAFPNSTFEGAYLLSRGRMPIFRNIAKKKQIFLNIDTRAQGLPNPSQALWYDIANGDENLTNAVSYTDNYINNRTFASSNLNTDLASFVNIDYYPHFQSQLEMYEATGERKYLDGAIESARRALPVMRATDMPTSKEQMYTPDVDLILKENQWTTKRTWFYDATGYRRGATLENINSGTGAQGAVFQEKEVTGYTDDAILVDDTPFPFWVASRVGLSLEQATSCSTQNQSIFMSTWAGELLRLGYLSNDQLMMDMARSSLVGRSSNYPGYYVANYYTTYGQEDYPKKGFDSTQLYFTHIPPYLAALQDYLFSNAWVKSDGKIDFPYVRSQGYVWFNTRQYGYEPGSMYDEEDMWPWLKEGTITLSGTDAKQIDWIAGRKDGRAAFALTNASDTAQTVTLNFNSDLGITSGSTATIYDQAGNKTTGTVNYDRLEVTVPAKGILTVAVDGTGITIPEYAKGSAFQLDTDDMGESALGLMYEGNTYTPSYNTTTLTTKGYSTETGYDVKAYALALDDTAYMGYIFVGGRSTDARSSSKTQQAIGDGEKGIQQSVLSWHYEGEDQVTTVTDTTFPFEFLIPVTEDPTKKIVFNVKTTFGDGTEKTLANDATIAPIVAEQEPEDNGDHFVQSNFEDFTPTTWYFGSSYLEIDFGIEKNPGFLENYFFPTDTTGDGKPDEMRALGINGALTGTAGNPNIYCEFISEVAFKLTFKGKEIVVPIYGARPTSDKKDVCLSVDLNSFNEAYVAAGGEAYATKSALSSDWNATNITSVKFTPNTVNMRAFPDGTVFISALKAAGSDMATTGDNSVKMMQGKNQEFNYTFGVATAGEYNAYVLTYDAAAGGRRGKVLVNGSVCDFTNDTVAPASLDTFWA